MKKTLINVHFLTKLLSNLICTRTQFTLHRDRLLALFVTISQQFKPMFDDCKSCVASTQCKSHPILEYGQGIWPWNMAIHLIPGLVFSGSLGKEKEQVLHCFPLQIITNFCDYISLFPPPWNPAFCRLFSRSPSPNSLPLNLPSILLIFLKMICPPPLPPYGKTPSAAVTDVLAPRGV